MVEAHLASEYNCERFKVVNHFTYSLCGDNHKCNVETDQDYVVFYCGNLLATEKNKINGDMNNSHHAICFETQHASGITALITGYSATTKYKLTQK